MFDIAHPQSREDIDGLKAVIMEAFGTAGVEYVDYVVDCYGTDRLIVLKENNRVEAGLTITPQPVFMGADIVPHCAVSWVCTRQENRMRGMSRACMEAMHRLAKEEEIPISSLHPFYFPFYKKMGWELGSVQQVISGNGGVFASMYRNSGNVRPYRAAYLNEIMRIYDTFAAKHTTMTCRTEKWWLKHPSWAEITRDASPDNPHFLVWERNGNIEAFAVVDYECEEDGTVKNITVTHTFGTAEGIREIAACLGGFADILTVKCAQDVRIAEFVEDPRAVSRSLYSYFMFRVHQPMRALEYLTPRGEGLLSFEIEDPFEEKPWRFSVCWSDGQAEILPFRNENTVVLPIGMFSMLYCGSMKPENYSEKIASLLSALLPKELPYKDLTDPG